MTRLTTLYVLLIRIGNDLLIWLFFQIYFLYIATLVTSEPLAPVPHHTSYSPTPGMFIILYHKLYNIQGVRANFRTFLKYRYGFVYEATWTSKMSC